jgi:hypothetical protein
MLCAAFAVAGSPYDVRHEHLQHGGPGILRIDDNSISFEERGKLAKHSRTWKYDDIQELTLGPDTLRIVTYEDNRWQFGRDRVYVFDRLPATLAAEWYPVFRARLDRRFVAALADEALIPEWQIPVKLAHGRAGSQGMVLVGAEGVVYKSTQAGESRTWRMRDLENVSSSGVFDLTITTHEREFRFQLKQELVEPRYQELWRRVNQGRGLEILKAVLATK